MKPDQRDAIKHPEKMGPLGDEPEHRKDSRLQSEEPTPIQEEAIEADRDQVTANE